MNKIPVCFFLLFFWSSMLLASTISGTDTNYAGMEIIWLHSADPITGTETEISRAVVGTDGKFVFDLPVSEITYLFAYLGTDKVFLFVEPEKHYEVVLPLLRPKTRSDKLNPFFRYTEAHLGIINAKSDDLNIQIRMFDDGFYPFYLKHSEKVFSNDVEFLQLDKDIEQLDKPFAKSTHPFFNDYRHYKYGMLRFVAYQHKSKSISDAYFKNQPFLANNPAYIELFNLVYDSYFDYFSRTEEGKLLAPAIQSKSYSAVIEVLEKDEVLQPAVLLNMVLLKSLHSEFYDDNFSRSGMLILLDSLIVLTDNETIKFTARQVYNKVTRLMAGYTPPAFALYDTDSNLVTLEKWKGKFVYLNFCSCFSYTCLNEFVMLQNLYNKHQQYLEIVTIVIDDDVQVVKDFLNRSGYQWTFLHFDNQPDILQQYDVRAFPTYYLVDNEGKLSISPAPAPADEFEGRLFKILQAKGIL